MFFSQLIEDYNFNDVVYVFENDKYFAYSHSKYKLTDKDKENFEILKSSPAEWREYSLEVLTLRKLGLLSRAEIVDQEDEGKGIRQIEFADLSGYPVDMQYSSSARRGLHLIISILLEQTFYIELEREGTRRKSQ